MAHWKTFGKNVRSIDGYGLSTGNQSDGGSVNEFYELDFGVVLDVVIDSSHPIFTAKADTRINPDQWPSDLEDKPPLPSDVDYTWIGRVLVRRTDIDKITDKDQLIWAYPMESNISEYPLINETVVLTVQFGKTYYSKKLNYHNWPNNNLDFSINVAVSGKENTILFSKELLKGKKESTTSYTKNSRYRGYAGQYFVANNKIRNVRRYEGDLVIESRHGQSIHMTAYDSNRANDEGDKRYSDYKDGGNPMILIRNRQRPLLKENQVLTLNGTEDGKIFGTRHEKNVGGYIEEDINHDGSSIQMTSGKTISKWVTTCQTRMFGHGEYKVDGFNGTTSFVYPDPLDGDQIVIQSDRLIFSSRYGESFNFSKKRYAIVTDSEFTVDAADQIVMTTQCKTVFNSPAIYLGEYDQSAEPVLMGNATVGWLEKLCDWLAIHVHVHEHDHVDAGDPTPGTTQDIPLEQNLSLQGLRSRAQLLASRRVFVVGGGLAPGSDGILP